MEKVNMLLGGLTKAAIKRGDTHIVLDFTLTGKNNRPISLTPSTIAGVTFVLIDERKEGEPIQVPGSVTSVNGEITMTLTDEFYEATGKFNSFLLEAIVEYQEDDEKTSKGIYPTDGYFSLEVMDTLLTGA